MIFLILLHVPGQAEMGPDERKALKQTQELLKDSAQRAAAVRRDPKAQEMDKKVEALAGSPENKAEIYDISAQVMGKITTEANGDPVKMQQIMLEAQKNPKAFYEKYFDVDQKAKVRGLASQIEKNRPSTGKGR